MNMESKHTPDYYGVRAKNRTDTQALWAVHRLAEMLAANVARLSDQDPNVRDALDHLLADLAESIRSSEGP